MTEITKYEHSVLMLYRDGTGPEHVAGDPPVPMNAGRAAWLRAGFPNLVAKGLIEPDADAGYAITAAGRDAIAAFGKAAT